MKIKWHKNAVKQQTTQFLLLIVVKMVDGGISNEHDILAKTHERKQWTQNTKNGFSFFSFFLCFCGKLSRMHSSLQSLRIHTIYFSQSEKARGYTKKQRKHMHKWAW